VLRAYDLVENGRSIQEVERTLHALRRWYPDAEVLPELEWKLVERWFRSSEQQLEPR